MSAPTSPVLSRIPRGETRDRSRSPTKKREDTMNTSALKPLPSVPSSDLERFQDAPSSPLQVNVRKENWAPQASRKETHDQPSSNVKGNAGIPYRPSHDMKPIAQFKESQPAVSEGNGSILPPKSSLSQQPPRIKTPDGADENASDVSEQPVPRLQYHHQTHHSEGGKQSFNPYASLHQNDVVETGASINRHLTPNSQMARRTPVQRPQSAYSDLGPRGRSPGPNANNSSPRFRNSSMASELSFGNRPLSYVDLANVSYPQAAPAPISMDNSQLRSVVGRNASLLSMNKTLSMYRNNIKKIQDVETQYAFAIFLIQCSQEMGLGQDADLPSPRQRSPKSGKVESENPYIEGGASSPQDLIREAKQILQKLSDRSYPFAQYYLADGYASGLFSKGKEDYGTAFPLFVSASKHGHAESGYRAALCYEYGWGSRRDIAKANQFYRQAASKNHPGAMTRLGRSCLTGDLGVKSYKEGLKWLNRASEAADVQYNAAPYHLGALYETGDGVDVFKDESYAAVLFTQAADLGHMEANYRLGDAYEHGKLSCPRDAALSVHFYTNAAQLGHPTAMMALCAWYMIGAEPILEKDENEAYEWARRAAELGMTKAEYAVGYFTEMGIGCRRDPLEANVWYVKAADAGDERAKHRLAAIRAAASGGKPMEVAPPRNASSKIQKGANQKGTGEKAEKDCVVM